MFVCHGNICRSPMAEFLMKDFLEKKGENDFFVCSSATSREELGNGVHYGTREILNRLGISCKGKTAVQLSKSDYEKYDYFIGMDKENRYNMKRIFTHDNDKKISLLLDYTSTPRDVADPWWTGDFEKTYHDVMLGIEKFYEYLKNKQL
jgi:protein-tyrosine phosphatase